MVEMLVGIAIGFALCLLAITAMKFTLSDKPYIQINRVGTDKVRLLAVGWKVDLFENITKFKIPAAKIILKKC